MRLAKMLEWRSSIGGNAAQARQAGRKVVQAELDQLDPLVADLLNGYEIIAKIKQDGVKAQMLLART